MAKIPPRWDFPKQYYFVTIVIKGRQPVFAKPAAREILKIAFHKTHPFYPFRLGALVILPEHWHALIRPGADVVIEEVVGAVKRNVLEEMELKKSIWQPRFLDHRIRDERDFYQHRQYIQDNPVKHGWDISVTEIFIHPNPW